MDDITDAARVAASDQQVADTQDTAKLYAAFYRQLKNEGMSDDHALELTREYMQGLLGTYRAVITGYED